MKKENVIKIVKYIIILGILVLGINIYVASNRIEHYSVLTPLENLTVTERIAATLCNSSFRSKEDLKKDGLLQSNETIEKDKVESLNKKEDIIECNYSKQELGTMSYKPTNFINKELKFTGVVVTDNNITKDNDIDVFSIKIKNTDIFVTMICDKGSVNYSSWRKGTNLKVNGYIEKIREDQGTYILLEKNPQIIMKN